MIAIDPSRLAEPADFDTKCRQAGNAWLQNNLGCQRPKDFWTAFKPQLANAFRDLCAYSAMYEPVGTVDHFKSWNESPTEAYEWSNYRFASGWVNSSKGKARGLLDPLLVEEGWFEVSLPDLQLRLSSRVPAEHRADAQNTIERLHLVHDERVMRQRRRWYEMYQQGEVFLDGLRRKLRRLKGKSRAPNAASTR